MKRWLETVSVSAMLLASSTSAQSTCFWTLSSTGAAALFVLAQPASAQVDDDEDDDDDDDTDDVEDDDIETDDPSDDDSDDVMPDDVDTDVDTDEPDLDVEVDEPDDGDDGSDTGAPDDDTTGDEDDDGGAGDDDGGTGDDDGGAGGDDGGTGDDDGGAGDDDGGATGGDDGGNGGGGDDDDGAGSDDGSTNGSGDDDDEGAPVSGRGGGAGGGSDDDDEEAPRGSGSSGSGDETGGAGIRGVSPSSAGSAKDPDERPDTRSSNGSELVDDEGYPLASRDVIAFDLGRTERALAEELGFKIVEETNLPGLGASLFRLRPPEDISMSQAADVLNAALPASPFDYNHLYGLPASDDLGDEGRAVQKLGTKVTGTKSVIAVIDTLVDVRHPSLAKQKITVKDFASSKGDRDRSHGTAVASIIVGYDPSADYTGIAPGATLLAANVFSVNAEGLPETDTRALISALDWAASGNAGVINISIAGPPSDVLKGAIQKLTAKGHVVTAAVGNDGPAAPPVYPAQYEGVIGVTAVDLDGKIYRRAGRGEQVDIAAPGVKILAADAKGGYSAVTGTSFATPVVSALIALSHPKQSEDGADIASVLAKDARDLGARGADSTYGVGLVQVAVSEVKP